MSEQNRGTRIAQDNSAARERGQSVAREYERVVSTFNRVLQFKEKVRLSLENRIRELQDLLHTNGDKFNTLTRNLKIYDQNVEKIAGNLSDLLAEETRIKEQYNKLLQGASMEAVGAPAGEESLLEEHSGEGGLSTENLMQKRNHYLDNLSSSFQKLDEDLHSIDCLRKEMLNARSEILRKKEQALDKKAQVEENERQLSEELERIESDLETSVKEEEVLTFEYAELINKVESCIEISEDIDRVLFSSLSAADDSASMDE
ncbi:hypothetical protein UR09_01120 [Candidatus Nitromaritima sp. SCGC AAA799-A02]|nr:hypothetical protein UR09_01120 [Candidatus Nitromaritima sp. SCGC AAA799-A02]